MSLQGYGSDSNFGFGGSVVVVDVEGADPAAALQSALSQAGPRIVVFNKTGWIDLQTLGAPYTLTIDSPDCVLWGAPGDGNWLKNGTIDVRANDVLISNLRVHPGGESEATPFGTRSSVRITGTQSGVPLRNIVLDHCSFMYCTDDTVTGWYEVEDCTVSNCIIANSLYNDTVITDYNTQKQSQAGASGGGLLFGNGCNRISIFNNVIACVKKRTPKFEGDCTNAAALNNAVWESRFDAIILGGLNGSVTANVLNNIIAYGPNTNILSEYILTGFNPSATGIDPPLDEVVTTTIAANYAMGSGAAWPTGTPVDNPGQHADINLIDVRSLVAYLQSNVGPFDRHASEQTFLDDIFVNGTATRPSSWNVSLWPTITPATTDYYHFLTHP